MDNIYAREKKKWESIFQKDYKFVMEFLLSWLVYKNAMCLVHTLKIFHHSGKL